MIVPYLDANRCINLIDRSVQPNRFSGVKVLVVDDEPDSLNILTLVLEQEGAEVRSVTSAAEALEAFSKSTPDLIISDIGMPETDGYSLITQIRALRKGKDLPAIGREANPLGHLRLMRVK
ncbi:response regulator [Pleurocapsales cyanobacterium LEGE 10410]|nr:response regulator [Pleurocapsales cyanobacterium LEGE 10410]